MMHNLANFSLSDMLECGMSMRKLGAGCSSAEEVANRFVDFLYDNFQDSETRSRNCVLVRFFQTLPYGELPPPLQEFARGVVTSEAIDRDTKCLTLLATRGEEEAWNSRDTSGSHKAIPLPSPEIITQFPMIAQLVTQFGVPVKAFIERDSGILVEAEEKTYNVFHVAEAPGSPFIPAQDDFVLPYGVRSVLGFGGLLPNGELFAIIIFSRSPISRETADAFSTIALSAKLAVLPYIEGGAVFMSQEPS